MSQSSGFFLLRHAGRPARYYRYYSGTRGISIGARWRAAPLTLAEAKTIQRQLAQLGEDFLIVDGTVKRIRVRPPPRVELNN